MPLSYFVVNSYYLLPPNVPLVLLLSVLEAGAVVVPCEEEPLLGVRVVVVVVTVRVREIELSLLYVLRVVVCPGLLLGRGGLLGVEGRICSFLLLLGTSRHVGLGLPVIAGRIFTGLLKFLLA